MRGSSPPAQPWWHNTAAGEDEYILDTPTVRTFVAKARAAISQATGPAEALEAIRPDFERLLEDDDWLPARYQAKAPESGWVVGSGSGSSFVLAQKIYLSSPWLCRQMLLPPCMIISPGAW